MKRTFLFIPLSVALLLASCATQANTARNHAAPTEWRVKEIQHGKASWYGVRCNGGTHTASGETLCDESATAAHKTLPMNTRHPRLASRPGENPTGSRHRRPLRRAHQPPHRRHGSR